MNNTALINITVSSCGGKHLIIIFGNIRDRQDLVRLSIIFVIYSNEN